MAENFYTILTTAGKAKLANSAVFGSKLNFKTLKVGDGKGAYYQPSENQNSLVNEVWSGNISSISVDENNPNWIVIETLIAAASGGFFIREAGIFDEDDDLIAISKLSETYKPVVSEGSIKDLCIKIILEVSNVESVTLKIDPTVIVATKNDVQGIEVEVKGINAQLSDLEKEISNGVIISPSIAYGMNSVIKNNSKVTASPKFTIQGKTLINQLGKDGNCEDVSKWTLSGATTSLDTSNKVVGSNSIKVTLTSTLGLMYKLLASFNADATKYYLISAYLKNGNATSVALQKDGVGGGVSILSTSISDTTKFNRVGVVVKPSDLNSANELLIRVSGASGQYAFVDGIMVNEITASEYALGVDALLIKYPYVDGYSCLVNPYLEIRHDNLVRNGNTEEGIGYWTSYRTTMSVENGKFKVVTGVDGSGSMSQKINVKPNTNLYLYGNVSNTQLLITDAQGVSTIKVGTGQFNTGNNSVVILCINNTSANQTGIVDSIMLVEGTTPPTEYKPCRIERTVIEGQFADGDSVAYENGEVSGAYNNKHDTLLGKNYDWVFDSDWVGFKRLKINNSKINAQQVLGTFEGVGYDGRMLKSAVTDGASYASADVILASPNGMVLLTIADTDTGFSESINPNADEAKVFMMGYKASASYGGRYVSWKSIVDGSIPKGAIKVMATTASTGTVATISSGGTVFAVGDYAEICSPNGTSKGIYYVNARTETSITFSSSVTVAIGDILVKCDGAVSGGTYLLNYCKNNIADGYEGYRLHYKLANPEPITGVNCKVVGDTPLISEGDNYLFLDSGIVLGEVANPVLNTANSVYEVNLNNYMGLNSNLKNKLELFITGYKNQIYDSNITSIGTNNYAYGKDRIEVKNFDPTATYTVDYKILDTEAPQVGAVGCSYTQDIISTLNNLQDEVGSRQKQDSALDDIVDLSVYEKFSNSAGSNWIGGGATIRPTRYWGTTQNQARIQYMIPFSVRKKVVPSIKITKFMFVIVDGVGDTRAYSKSTISTDSTIDAIGVIATKDYIIVDITLLAGTNCNNALANGCLLNIEGVADCRERI